jgi:ribonuclease-3
MLDGGFEAAQQAIHRLYEPVLRNVDPNTLGKDAKTLLQEWLQSRKIPLPVYLVVATHGAAHNQLFEVECSVPRLSIQVLGSGASRRAAEQAAAKRALEQTQTLMPTAPRKPRRPAVRALDPSGLASPPVADMPSSGAKMEASPADSGRAG